jgi:hypothetical protein
MIGKLKSNKFCPASHFLLCFRNEESIFIIAMNKTLIFTAIKVASVACLVHAMRPVEARADGCQQYCDEVPNCVGAPSYLCTPDYSDNNYCGAYNPPSCYDPGGGACDDGSECKEG